MSKKVPAIVYDELVSGLPIHSPVPLVRLLASADAHFMLGHHVFYLRT